jgi:hypothetical protein
VIAASCYPRQQEPVGLGAAAKGQRDRITDRDPGWQADVMIRAVRTRDQPINSLGQDAVAARPDGTDGLWLGRGTDTRDTIHQADDPQAMRFRPSKLLVFPKIPHGSGFSACMVEAAISASSAVGDARLPGYSLASRPVPPRCWLLGSGATRAR